MYPLLEDISSDEEDLPKKRCSAEILICQPDLVLPVEDQDIVYLGTYNTTKICQPDVDIPAEDEDIVYLGTYKKTSPRAPPNTPTYPSISAASNIWLEGTSVYPVQVCLVILSLYYILYIKIFSGGADCSGDGQAVAPPHPQLHLTNKEDSQWDPGEARRRLDHSHHQPQHRNEYADRKSPDHTDQDCFD